MERFQADMKAMLSGERTLLSMSTSISARTPHEKQDLLHSIRNRPNLFLKLKILGSRQAQTPPNELDEVAPPVRGTHVGNLF